MKAAEITLKQLAQDAINVCDASNMSGVLRGWTRAMDSLRQIMPTADTACLNRHPINKLWAYKVYSLACGEPLDSESGNATFLEAYSWCKQHAE